MLLSRKGIAIMKAEGLEPAAWVTEMLAAGKSFYTVTDGATHFTTFLKHKQNSGQDDFIILNNIHAKKYGQ
jgi:3-hydroxyacyl-CoA dehydrogenase